MRNSCWQHEWLFKLTHTHIYTHTACTLSSAVLNVGVLMLGKFLSQLVGEECCQDSSCSNSTFPCMWSEIGNSGERLTRTDTHTCAHGEKHMYLEPHMHSLESHRHICRVKAEELERLDVTGLIIEGCPLKLLHSRAQKIKLSYQWAAQHPPPLQKILPSTLHFSFSVSLLSLCLPLSMLRSRFEVFWRTERAFQLFSVSFVMV